MALSMSLTARLTASSLAKGAETRLVNTASVLPGASRVARPMICTTSVSEPR